MLKIGLIGSEENCIKYQLEINKSANAIVSGIFDSSSKTIGDSENSYFQFYKTPGELFDNVDIVCITQKKDSFEIISTAIKNSKHVFLPFPVSFNINDIETIVKLAGEAGVKVQMSLNEYYYPVFKCATKFVESPLFIDAKYNNKNADLTSYINNNLLYDVMIIMNLVNCDIRKITTISVPVLNNGPGLINVRIEFNNGCIANITVDGLSPVNKHEYMFYQKGSMIRFNLIEKKFSLSSLNPVDAGGTDNQQYNHDNSFSEQFYYKENDLISHQVLSEEINSFIESIKQNIPPKISIEDYYKTCQVIQTITERIKIN
ncbi:Gfo/Idh/MocA family oxidoreductase [Bacteroidota bacterium]